MIARSKCAMRLTLEPPSPPLHARPVAAHALPGPGFCTAPPRPLPTASPAACDPPPRAPLTPALPAHCRAPVPSPCLTVLAGLACGSGCDASGTASPTPQPPAVADAPRTFDLEAHRGGAGLTVESTLAAFGHALDLGVTTLELDTQITRDGRAVVTHDPAVDGRKCRDTAPATPGDPAYPYVGKHVNTLAWPSSGRSTAAAARCPSFPGRRPPPDARIPLLSEVFALARSRSADSVRFNIETKISADAPSESASGEAVRAGARRRHPAGRGRRPGQHRVLRLGFADADEEGLARSAAGRAHRPEEPRGGPARRVTVARGHRHRRLRRRRGGRGRDSFGAEAVSPVHGCPSGARWTTRRTGRMSPPPWSAAPTGWGCG